MKNQKNQERPLRLKWICFLLHFKTCLLIESFKYVPAAEISFLILRFSLSLRPTEENKALICILSWTFIYVKLFVIVLKYKIYKSTKRFTKIWIIFQKKSSTKLDSTKLNPKKFNLTHTQQNLAIEGLPHCCNFTF